MSWIKNPIKKRLDDYLVKILGSRAIFDQEQTLEIKKKSDYYENKLALPEVLKQLSTPAPVVGDITTMTDPLPGVRLPRIPYYEYIYYLMRWNSSVLRMIGLKLKQEIFRETRLNGFIWEGKFKTKCSDCGTEFDEQLEECDYCHSKNVVAPDPTQKKILEPFIIEANKAEQTLLEVFEEIEDDLNTIDDSYLIFLKDYFVGPGGLFGQVKEIMRGDTSRFRIVSDISGRRGRKWWVCPAHRGEALKEADYKKKQICDICGLPMQEVHYVETTVGGITPQKYFIKGEVVHCSKYEPSRLYGIPPIFSVYIVARTIQLMDLYTEEYYEKGRLKGVLAVPSENTVELKKWWDEIMIRMRNDPYYVPIVGMGSDLNRNRGRMEFVKLVDNMNDLRFQEHRKLLKEEIAGLFGVNLIFLADSSVGGGLNNEGLQITVTDRTIEWGQSVHHDQFFPKLLEYLNITDWSLKLKPSKETDEMAELQRFDLRVDTATKLQGMGYKLDLRDDKFEVTGKAFIVDKPQQFGSFGGQGSLPQQGGNQKLLPAATQEGKPEKPKPAEEIQRSLEKDRLPSHLRGKTRDQLHETTIDQFTRIVFEAAEYGDWQELNRIKGILGKERFGTFNNLATKKYYLDAAYKIYREEVAGKEKSVNIPKHLEDLEDRFDRCMMVANPTGHQKHFCQAIINALKTAISRKQNQLVGRYGQGQYQKMPSEQQKEYDRLSKLYNQTKKYERNRLSKSIDLEKMDEDVLLWSLYRAVKAVGGGLPPIDRVVNRLGYTGMSKDQFRRFLLKFERKRILELQIASDTKFINPGGYGFWLWNNGKIENQRTDRLRPIGYEGRGFIQYIQFRQKVDPPKQFQKSDDFLGEFTKEEIQKGLLPMSIISKICSYLSFTKADMQVDPECLASQLSTIAAKNPSWSKNQVLDEAVSRCQDSTKFDDGEDHTDEMNEYLEEAFGNPDNYVYIDTAKATGKPEYFDMIRNKDESGTSGTGHVGSGIVFPDGQVVFRWLTDTKSTAIYESLKIFNAIHVDPHPGNDTEFDWREIGEKQKEANQIIKSLSYWDEINGDVNDFAKSVVERGRDVIAEYKIIEHNFAKQLEEIYLKKLAKKIAKLDDKSSKRLIKEIESIVTEATPLIEKIAFSEVLRAYKKGKKLDESQEVSKTIALPDNITEPFRAEYGAFGLDKDDWQVLRAIYRQNPFWNAFQGMSQSVSDKLKEHITESYEAPNSSRMKATIKEVKQQYPKISNKRAEIIAYGRIGKFSLPKILGEMKRIINAETYRLERIARTETTAITSKGREMNFRQRDPEGLHKYDWFGPNDHRNSEECPEIKRRVKKEGKGKGIPLNRLLAIQKEVVEEKNRLRKTAWVYRDWTPHANCRHGLRRIV